MLQTEDGFSNTVRERALKPRKKPSAKTNELTADVNPLFECSVPGCTEAFDSFSDLELHLDIGQHNNKQLPSESVYDRVQICPGLTLIRCTQISISVTKCLIALLPNFNITRFPEYRQLM